MTTMAATNAVPPTTTCSCSVSGRWDDPQTINRSASRRAAAARPFGSNSGVAFKQWSIISTSCAETAPAQAQRGLEHLSLGYGGYQRRREAGRVRARARARARAVAGQELSDGFQTTHFSKPGSQSRIIWAKAAGTNSTLFRLHKGFKLDFSSVEVEDENQHEQTNGTMASLSALVGVSTFIFYSGPAYAKENGAPLNPAYGEVGVILELGVQLLYLGALLTLLGVGSFLVVRQVLIKRELESAAKELQDRVRSGEASSLEYFELGAVMLRKKFYQVARKHLNDAIRKWDGSEQDLAQVYNALGFSYFSEGKIELAISQYEKSVNLQPMYVTAWNNLADAYETQKNYPKALKAYEEALQFDPSNKVATAKREQMKLRVERFQGIPKK